MVVVNAGDWVAVACRRNAEAAGWLIGEAAGLARTVTAMIASTPGSVPLAGVTGPLSQPERAVDELLTAAHLCAAHQLPGLLARHGERLGVRDAMLYLADLQQEMLVPFLGSGGPATDQTVIALGVDATREQ